MSTATGNRLLDHGGRRGPSYQRTHVRDSVRWSTPHAAAQRGLVVLIENGGIDLGLPELVGRLIDAVPGAASVIGQATRDVVVERLRNWLRGATDTLLESAELALNHFSTAQPDTYGTVTVLRDSTATFAELRAALFDASRSGTVIDLLVLTHGSREYISTIDGIDAARIRSLRAEFGGPLSIRSVYMMNCVGSSLNQAWLDVGARVSAGSHENNYLPEPTTHFFWAEWRAGKPFESAVTGAYRRTVDMMNEAVRDIVSGLVPLAGPALASRIDLSTLDFVVASRPEVVGAGSLTIQDDVLPPPTTSSGMGLVTTVLPSALSRGLSASGAVSAPVAVSPAGRQFIERWELPLLRDVADAPSELARRIAEVERFLAERVTTPLSAPQLDAVACFALGVGARAFERSRLLRLVQEGDLTTVPAEMRKWTKARRSGEVVESTALVERRNAEAEMFSGPGLALPASREVRQYAWQQNPGAIALGEAIQIGLGAASIVQSQVNASPGGELRVTYERQERLLTPDARLRMPGAMRPKSTYRYDLFRLPSMRLNAAQAVITVSWEGNDYGEISTPVIEPDLSRTSDWSRSEATINVTAIRRIPTDLDPRAWPLWYHYAGSFDPWGNGEWNFQGDFEVNAFGGLRFHDHRWVSHSTWDWPLDVHPDTWKGRDVVVPVPAIPADQMAYLREHVPG